MTLQEQLTRDESLRLKPYRDSVGKLSIGVGRNLDDEGITREEAEFMLNNDIASHDAALFAALPWVKDLDDARQGVLRNMCFNMGIHGLLGFRQTLALIQQGKYAEAAEEMLNSKWATQVGARAQRLAKQLEEGVWV